MKEVIALIVFVMIFGLTIILALRKRIENSLAAILLLFSLLSGWTIANYDWLQRLQWKVPGLEAFQKEIQNEKECALSDMEAVLTDLRKEVAAKKESLVLVASEADDVRVKVEEERKAAHASLENFKLLEATLRAEEANIRELSGRVESMGRQIESIHQASSELALSMARLVWLLLEAREEYGAERAQAAVRLIMDRLDDIVGVAIVDPNARAEFIADVMNSVPPRR